MAFGQEGFPIHDDIGDKPVVTCRHLVAVEGAVPSRSVRTDLLQELPVAVKDMYDGSGQLVHTCNVPGIEIAVAIRSEVLREVHDQHLALYPRAAVPVYYRYGIVANRYVYKDVRGLCRQVVELVEVITDTVYGNDDVVRV